MKTSTLLRAALLAAASATLAACVTDPRLNAGLSIGQNGVMVQPSVQANVGGGLLQYTPQ
jgi:hypothetical protein